jgi:hypothetical protein
MKDSLKKRVMHLLDLLHKEYIMDNGISQEIAEVREALIVEYKYKNIDDFICKNEVDFECKPFSWDDNKYATSIELDDDDISYLKNKLATYSAEDLLEDCKVSEIFNDDVYNGERHFLITHDSSLYLVDTQGYSYIRYMVKVVSK